MVSEEGVDITEAEAAIYDRQIRLWGVESQKRIRNANILIAGLNGLGAEVAKNLILAGIKSVTFLDDAVVTADDRCAQFLVSCDSLGQNRAEASVARAKVLNPMVVITADTGNVNAKPDEYFSKFDVVVVTGCNLEQLQRINSICRLRDVKFFCGDIFGMFGYYFADCAVHKHVAEMTYRDKKGEKVYATRVTTYVPISDTLDVDWTLLPERRFKRMDPSYFIFRVLQRFRQEYKRDPDRLQREADIEILKKLSKTVLEELSVATDKIPEMIFGMVFGNVSPSCAIVGGILAQDVIRAVSRRDTPVANMFFFNPDKCCGTIENLGNVQSV